MPFWLKRFFAIFLSTLPARGATGLHLLFGFRTGDFYPRSPRGERHTSAITTPSAKPFLSTLPARGATLPADPQRDAGPISIHAPREGSDCRTFPAMSCTAPFLSTLPARGATEPLLEKSKEENTFLSTLPARGATGVHDFFCRARQISIHAPREGSDCCRSFQIGVLRYFYPRSPRGERRGGTEPNGFQKDFYPRSPRGERRGQPPDRPRLERISIHAPREGSDCCRSG